MNRVGCDQIESQNETTMNILEKVLLDPIFMISRDRNHVTKASRWELETSWSFNTNDPKWVKNSHFNIMNILLFIKTVFFRNNTKWQQEGDTVNYISHRGFFSEQTTKNKLNKWRTIYTKSYIILTNWHISGRLYTWTPKAWIPFLYCN